MKIRKIFSHCRDNFCVFATKSCKMHLCPFFYRPICGNWKTAIWIIDKFHIQNSNKITSYIKGALLWGVVELCGHPTRQSGIVGSEMNSLRGGGGNLFAL